MIDKFIAGPLVFAAVLFVVVVLLLSGRSVLRVLFRGWIGRRLFQPIYRWTLRPVFRLLRRIFGTPAQQGAQVQVGAAPYNAAVRVIGGASLALEALGDIPVATRKMVRRQPGIFRSANANQAVDTLQGSLSLDDAKRNLDSARNYYEAPIEQRVSANVLYEDSEEALIIGILRDVDLTFFYVTRRIRRNVSRNVIKLISIVTGIIALFPLVVSGLNLWSNTLAGLGLSAVFCVAIGLFHLYYSIVTRYNGQNFNYFVQTYFGRLLNQHKSAATGFANVLNDRISDLEKAQTEADIWFLNLHWLPARQWFLELYVRNMFFQIARNLWLSYFFAPFLLLVSLSIYLGLSFAKFPNLPNVLTIPPHTHWWNFFLPLFLLLSVYVWSLRRLLHEFWQQITFHSSLGFGTMDFKGVVERNIGPIVREIVDKRRNPYGQRGGPP